MSKKVISFVLALILLVTSIGVYWAADSSSSEPEYKYNILEVVTNEKYQKMSYFVSGFEPVNLEKIKNGDNLYSDLSVLKTLKLTGSKITTYKEVDDTTDKDVVSYSQLGYFKKSSDGNGGYAPVYFDSTKSYDVYKKVKDNYNLVDESELDKTDKTLYYKVEGKYYSYYDIEHTPSNAKYVLYFVSKESGDWSFYPAFSGRYYVMDEDTNLYKYKEEIKIPANFNDYIKVGSSRYEKDDTLRMQGEITAYETSFDEKTKIENRNLLNDIIGTDSIGVKVVKYSDLSTDLIDNADLIYFNTNTGDTDVSKIYERYNKPEDDNNKQTTDSKITITKAISQDIVGRMISNKLNVIFDETCKSSFDLYNLSEFGILYALLNTTSPSIINKSNLKNKFGAKNKSMYANYTMDTSLYYHFPNDTDYSMIGTDFSKFGINNMELLADFVIDHGVLSLSETSDFITDFNSAIVYYDDVNTSKAFDYFNKTNTDNLTLKESFDFLLHQKKESNLGGEVRILEIEPVSYYLGNIETNNYWYWRMYGIDSYFNGKPENIKVTRVTSREFISRKEDLINTYDIVYIGSKISKYGDNSSGSIHSYFKQKSLAPKLSKTLTEVQSVFYRTNYSIGLEKNKPKTLDIKTLVTTDSQVKISEISGGKLIDGGSTRRRFTLKDDKSGECTVKFTVTNIVDKEFSLTVKYYISDANKSYNLIELDNKLSDIASYKDGYYGKINGAYFTFSKDVNYRYIKKIDYGNNQGFRFVCNLQEGLQENSDAKIYVIPYFVSDVTQKNVTKVKAPIAIDIGRNNIVDIIDELRTSIPDSRLGTSIVVYYDKAYDEYIKGLECYLISYEASNIDVNMWTGNNTLNKNYNSSYDFTQDVKYFDTSKYKEIKIKVSDITEDGLNITEKGLKANTNDLVVNFSCNSDLEGNFKIPYKIVGVLQESDYIEEELFRGSFIVDVFKNYDKIEWGIGFPVAYADEKMNGKIYTKLGDLRNIYRKPDIYADVWFTGITSYDLDKNGTTRGSGNDITDKKFKELKEFIKSGRLVLISDAFYFDHKLVDSKFDLSSNVYKIATYPGVMENTGIINYDFSYITDDTFSVEFSQIPQVYKDINYDKDNDGTPDIADIKIDEVFTGVDGTSASLKKGTYYLNGDDVNYKTLTYKFKINTLSKSDASYSVKLYVDLISDGFFSDNEELKGVRIIDSSGRSVKQDSLVKGEEYTLLREVDPGIAGLIHWQLKFKRNDNASVRREYDCYTAILSDDSNKKTLNILQMLPTNTITFNMQTDSEFQSLLGAVNDFKVNVVSVEPSKLVGTDGNLVNEIDVNGESLSFYDFDMLVIGFADAGVYSNNKNVLEGIKNYIDSGKSVLFTHDTNHYVNMYNTLQYQNHLLNLAFFYTKYFRSVIGQDRYGVAMYDEIDYDKLAKNDFSDFYVFSKSEDEFREIAKTNNNKDIATYADRDSAPIIGNTEGISDYLLYGKTIGDSSNWVNSVERINTGQISYYPYYIPSQLNVATTHAQYYQLDLESDDLNVWYTLSKDSYKDPQNGRDLYYIYNKGNITYSGVGHSKGITTDEKRLFVNTLIMAYRTSGLTPRLEVTNPEAENTNDASYFYLDYDATPDTTELVSSSIVGDKIKIDLMATDISVTYNKHNYITVDLVTSEGTKPLDGSYLFKPDKDNNLTSLTRLDKITDKEGNTIVEKAYELPDSGEFCIKCSIKDLMDDSDIYSGSSDIKLVCKLYSTYGVDFDKKHIEDEKTIVLIKRGLFDIH